MAIAILALPSFPLRIFVGIASVGVDKAVRLMAFRTPLVKKVVCEPGQMFCSGNHADDGKDIPQHISSEVLPKQYHVSE